MLTDLFSNHMTFTLQSKVESGEYVLDEMIVPQTLKKVSLTKEGHLKTNIYRVWIPLSEIRKRMLKEHESLGIVRIWKDDFYDSITEDELSSRLVQLGEESGEGTPSEMRDRLKGMERKRHLMVWGENSTLLNHGHLLLTVSTIYDEAIYYTNEGQRQREHRCTISSGET